jgi:hypothetical protein
MKFDYVYLLSFIIFFISFISFISLGYTALRCLKSKFIPINRNCYKSRKIKFLDYNIYLDITDYVTYEKYQIWRFYFPA